MNIKNMILPILIGVGGVAFSPFLEAKCYVLKKTPVKVGFFNGVNTTPEDAHDKAEVLKSLTGKEVELFYNQTRGMFLDVMETFRQRIAEGYPVLADRVDVMADMLQPYGLITQRMLDSGDPGIGYAVRSFRDAVLGLERKAIAQIDAATVKDYQAHQSQLQQIVVDGHAILVAHSQGNLFANRVYGAMSPEKQKKISRVHVAPASVHTNGSYFLSDWDFVIKPLAKADGRPPTHTLSWMQVRTSRNIDWTGHGFSEIYLNDGLPFVKPIVEQVNKVADDEKNELYGTYRWVGSIDNAGAKGSAWVKATLKGKTGTWETGNGCLGDVTLESVGEGRWQATLRTMRGKCPATLSGELVAKGNDARQIAILPFGVGEWVMDAVKPRLVNFGINGGNTMQCVS